MNRFNKTLAMTGSLIALAALTACGGGGGGGGTSGGTAGNGAAQPARVVAVDGAGTLALGPTMPASYLQPSFQNDVYNALNSLRLSSGVGMVQQSSSADAASQNHADYLNYTAQEFNNGRYTSPADVTAYSDVHKQYAQLVADQPALFYATTVGQRVNLAFGAPMPAATEVIAGGASGALCISTLANSVYHLDALMAPYTSVGVSSYTDEGGSRACQVTLVRTSTYGQTPAASDLGHYPFGGATVPGSFNVDSEVPRPSATLLPNGFAGTPILVSARNADFVNAKANGTVSVEISTFTITNNLGAVIPAVLLTGPDVIKPSCVANECGSAPLGEGVAVLVPQDPLLPGSYTVTYTAAIKPSNPDPLRPANLTVSKSFGFIAQ